MDTDITFPPGTPVSWKSSIAPYRRRFGTVVRLDGDHYHVRTSTRMVLPIHRSRVTKECG